MFYKSIRFKITILYMAILAATLTCFSTILYYNVANGLGANTDTLLKSRAGGISQAVNTYWETSKFENVEPGVLPDVLKKRRNTNFAKIAQKWVKEESSDPRLLDIIVRIFDTDGKTIAFSKNAEGLSNISRGNFISVLQGKSRFDIVTPEIQVAKMTFRVFTTPVFENEKVAYIIQVAIPLASVQIALANLRVALFLLFPITVLLTGVMGAFLAKVTLRPVDSMIRTIHQITAENMKLRINVPDTKDEIQDLAGTFNDMLKRLEHAFITQRQLFEDLSHELKTPLTILKGEFEVALKKARSGAEYEAALRSALEETNRIIKLAENLLALARFDSKEMYLEKRPLDLNILLQGIVNHMRALAGLKEIKLFFNPASGIIVDGDEDQLKALFINIIDNAIKYTPPQGEIWVGVEKGQSHANVKVRDTGIGISEGELGHIFDRFYRVERSRESSGFGLGLSIARSIAESHDGRIDVESKPGVGTTFTITLPVAH